ncbi:hypothetical protein [Variovorax sp. 3P27G3]|jgi:hypothetical protein|uniref:hypothetical protein n=1 Tax=Variovorax sp. 3P27G3 TaxID=2502214 RepID=UPI001485AADA|nr:hypothetical protein [Variovorax sp. 3P27G3]
MYSMRSLEVLFEPKEDKRDHTPSSLAASPSNSGSQDAGSLYSPEDRSTFEDVPSVDGRIDKKRGGEREEGTVEGLAPRGRKRLDVGSFGTGLLCSAAPSRGALVRGVVSTLQETTEHLLNQTHQSRQVCRGQSDFSADSSYPDFWGCMAHVLSTHEYSPEQALVSNFFGRLKNGHEGCLKRLKDRYDEGDHCVPSFDGFDDNQYIAYRLRRCGVCPRLVTFELLQHLLSPNFVRNKITMGAISSRSPFHEKKNWPPIWIWMKNIPRSNEWDERSFSSSARRVLPPLARKLLFEQHLRALEWALFRKEGFAGELGRIGLAANEIVCDFRLVVVSTKRYDGGVSHTYFDSEESARPDWSALTKQRPSHINDSFQALKDVRNRIRVEPL